MITKTLPPIRDAGHAEKILDHDHRACTSEACPRWQGQQSDKVNITLPIITCIIQVKKLDGPLFSLVFFLHPLTYSFQQRTFFRDKWNMFLFSFHIMQPHQITEENYPCPEKGATLFLPLTLSNTDQFSKILSHIKNVY